MLCELTVVILSMTRMITMTIRSYTELQRLYTIEERYDYLRLRGAVGSPTFAHERWMNQRFYKSVEWRRVRNEVIARDEGCDLGVEGFEIFDRPYIHHMNPMMAEDLKHGNLDILNPEYLITVSMRTHNAIHYGDETLLPQVPIVRRPGDTKLW